MCRHKLLFFSLIYVDIPLTAIFDKGNNSSHVHEQQEEDRNAQRDLQGNINERDGKKHQEQKEREKEDGERLVQFLLVIFIP